jgi:hypothetical protein
MVGVLESSDLTRVGPGTVIGELMRRYWLPAALSSEVAIDGPPLRLMLLGEQLIAFRDSAGRVGVMDQRCPHRCASLFRCEQSEDQRRRHRSACSAEDTRAAASNRSEAVGPCLRPAAVGSRNRRRRVARRSVSWQTAASASTTRIFAAACR